ncbi:MAG TPA: FixH family protein [Polyangiaceae bacterium]|jgi:hypothetical protein|nr:FixH family protein [Polyangiaceae bacterium]
MNALSRARLAAVPLLAATACSSASPTPTGAFPPDPYATTMSDSSALVLDVRTSPQPPSRGTNAVQLTITRASDGTPVDGLALDVEPWMPSMDHGTSTPTVTPEGGGVYLVTEVYLYMPGLWTLRTGISGAMTDHATPQLDVE